MEEGSALAQLRVKDEKIINPWTLPVNNKTLKLLLKILHICVQQYDSDPSSYYSVNGTMTFFYKTHQAILAKLTSEQGQVGP